MHIESSTGGNAHHWYWVESDIGLLAVYHSQHFESRADAYVAKDHDRLLWREVTDETEPCICGGL